MTAKQTLEKQVHNFNAHDIEAFGAQYRDDAVVHDPFYSEPLRGKDAIKQDMKEFWQAFPDARDTLQHVVDQDGVCASEASLEATHRGTLPSPEGEISASGKPIKFHVAQFFKVDDQGKIIEEHRYYDVRGMLKQIQS